MSQTDEFLPYLQRLIQERQDERTELLQRVAALDGEIQLLQRERDLRTQPHTPVPDFPPVTISAEVETQSITEAADAIRQAEEDIDDEGDDFVLDSRIRLHLLEEVPLKTAKYKEITKVLVRDWFSFYGTDWVKSGLVAEDLGISPQIVNLRCQDLMDQGTILHNGKARGGSRYKYNGELPAGPRVKPRGERLPVGRGRATGTAVPHTGRTPGASGKPGQDKKNSARIGRKVGSRRKKQGHG